ncbi:MAG: class F sortase [Micropruina sp.]|nr:class F sortase [Micropruina sp.]
MAGVLLMAGGLVGLRATWTAAAPAPMPSVEATSVAGDSAAGASAEGELAVGPGSPPDASASPAPTSPDSTKGAVAAVTAPRLRIVALGVEAPLESHSLGAATWQGQQVSALVLPKEPARLTRWGGGADPCQRPSKGTVLISGHVASAGVRGALWSLADSRSGTIATIACPDGSASTWRQVGGAGSSAKTDLPQDFFAADGPLRLVTVTCGGRVLADGHYESNVWAIWEPVAP